MSGTHTLPNTTLKGRLRLWSLLLLVPASVAFGQADDAGRVQAATPEAALADALSGEAASGKTEFSINTQVPDDGDSVAEFVHDMESGTTEATMMPVPQAHTSGTPASEKSRLKVGMSLEEALEVLGKDPDSQSEIGAACGKFNVLTWDEDGTRLISVDGTISSVYEGKQKPQE
jgi:hypothetical protein